jgi:hypothetical protein
MTIVNQIKAGFETAKTVSHTGVGAAFANLGSPTSHVAHAIYISSTLNDGSGAQKPISAWISINGNNQLLVPGNSFIPINISGNAQGNGLLGLPEVTQFQVKQGPDGAPSAGDISVTILYGS